MGLPSGMVVSHAPNDKNGGLPTRSPEEGLAFFQTVLVRHHRHETSQAMHHEVRNRISIIVLLLKCSWMDCSVCSSLAKLCWSTIRKKSRSNRARKNSTAANRQESSNETENAMHRDKYNGDIASECNQPKGLL